jgi:multidrug efflux pump subunit AcrB
VRENIFRHIELGQTPKEAAEKGTAEVKLAVIATTMTVIAVFLPVGFLQGMVGQFFKQFGLTVVFAMVISLFDALTTAPMLSAYMITKIDNTNMSAIGHIFHWPAEVFGKFQDWLDRVYEKIMRFTLVHKLRVLLIAVAIALTSFGLVRFIPKTFMPTNEFGEFIVSLEADPGTSLDQMGKMSTEIDSLIRREKDVELVQLTVGNANGESNVASLFVKMTPYQTRTRSTSDLKAYLRTKLLPYSDRLKVSVNDISMAGDAYPFELLLTGENLQELSDIADRLLPQLRNVPGLTDVESNYRPGKPEFQVKMDPLKMEKLGVQSLAAGLELRGMVEGNTPAKFRENGLEYDIRVHLQEDQKDLSGEFGSLYVPNVNNQLVKLKNISEPLQTTGPSKVFRRNRSRYVMITGNLTKTGAIGNVMAAATEIIKKEKLPDSVGYEFIGASEDMKDLFKNMVIAMVLSVLFIYLALASLYESVVVPFTIMMALPFSMVGAFLALLITHESFNIFTMIGIIMLLGLVTKNSILLVDYTQRLMRQGMERNEALIKAGLTRLRPILMTTFALIAGMLPLALGLAEVAKFRKGMGIAIIGGLLSSTFLTLIVIPAIFGYMDTLRLWLRKITGRPLQREVDKSVE